MRERQLDHVQYMSTFHGTNGMSVKHQYTDAFSLERPEMLSGDAALLFQAYSGCTGNILSFYPSTSPCSISDPLTINDFFPTPQVCLFRLPLLPTFIFSCWIAKVSHATLLLLPSPFRSICLKERKHTIHPYNNCISGKHNNEVSIKATGSANQEMVG